MAEAQMTAEQIENAIVGMTLLEASAMVKRLEERLGVSAAAAAPVETAEVAPEKQAEAAATEAPAEGAAS